MLTLEQFLKSVRIDADKVDIHLWDEGKWEYTDYYGFCDYPTNAFILSQCKECKNHIVTCVSTDIINGSACFQIEIQKKGGK